MALKPQTFLLLLLVATLTVAHLICNVFAATDANIRNPNVDEVMSWQVVDRPEQDPALLDIAQYAVAAYNAKAKNKLKFVGVVSCKHHDGAAGILDRLVIKAVDGGVTKTFEANVWVKPWIKYKNLISFKCLV